MLEKNALEKERMYNDNKNELDEIANLNHKLKRTNEDLLNNKKILDSKLKTLENSFKQVQEELKNAKLSNDKLESSHRLLSEELSLVQKSFEEMAGKKQTELELLTREVNASAIKDKDFKQKVHYLEKELAELRDAFRSKTLRI